MKFTNLLFSLILCSCVSTPEMDKQDRHMMRQDNACLPSAIAFRESLKGKAVWSKVLVYERLDSRNNAQLMGHAICCYMYPIGKNQLWTWDKQGSFRTRAYIDNPNEIAQKAEDTRWYASGYKVPPYIVVKNAEFLE